MHFFHCRCFLVNLDFGLLIFASFCSAARTGSGQCCSSAVSTVKGHLYKVKRSVRMGSLYHIGSRAVKAGSCQKDHPGHCYSSFSFSRNSFFSDGPWVECIQNIFCLVKVGATSTGETSLFLTIDPEGLLHKPRVPEDSV